MTEQAYIGLLEAEFRSCPVSREQIERAFEVAIIEVKSPELSYGNLSILLCQMFRNGSSQPCLSDATQKQIRADFEGKNKKQSPVPLPCVLDKG